MSAIKNINAEKIQGNLAIESVSATTYYNLPTSGGSFTGGTVTGATNFTAGLTANTIYTDYIDFNTNYTPTQQVGRIHWDVDYGTLDVDLEGNNVNLKIGLDNLYYIKNQSGSTINKGRVVRAAGTLGNSGRILGEYMIADGSIPYYYTLGIAGENILDGEDGYVYEFGLIKGINTTGSLYGETWSDGTILYVHPTIAGGLTSIEPTEPNLKIQMCIVIKSDSNGSIFVRPSLGYNLGDLHDLQTSGQTNGDLISYDSSNGYWGYSKTLNGSYIITGDTTVGGVLSGSTLETGGFIANSNGVFANIISGATYQNLPKDVFVTGGSYNAGSSVLTFTNNTGGTFTINGVSTGATIGTYLTGASYSNNILSFTTNSGTTSNVTINTMSGLTVNGTLSTATLSATTYLNLPTDVRVTGGTYSNGSLTFTNNTGGTFNIITSTNYAAGIISGATGWSSNGAGQINLPAIKVALYNNSSNIEPIVVYDVASGTTNSGGIPSLTDNNTNYIVVEYNGGTPRYYVYDNDGLVNDSSVVLVYIVYRLGNFVHVLEFGNQGAGLANKLNDRFIMTDRFGWESGLSIGLSGTTGIVTLTSGVAWNGSYRQSLNAANSSGDTFFKNYHSGGTWTYTTTGDTLNNTYYDNGTNIVTATAGKYLTNYYYRGQETNSHIYEVYSTAQYDSVTEAEAATNPDLPELITSHAFLVGRIIVLVGANTGITQTAFATVFSPSGYVPSSGVHNNLSGLQGGTSGEYYHLTSSEYNNLAYKNVNNNFSSSQTINGTLSATTISAATYQNLPYSGTVIGTGTTNYLARWTGSTALGNSIIQDDGTTIGFNISPQAPSRITINGGSLTAINAYSIGIGIIGEGQSGAGVQGQVYQDGPGTYVGVKGIAYPNDTPDITTVYIGGLFTAFGGYSVQLQDGTEGVGKFLYSVTSDGKARWTNQLSASTFTITSTPINNNSNTQVLTRNSSTGAIEYTDSSSLGGGGFNYGLAVAISSGNYLI